MKAGAGWELRLERWHRDYDARGLGVLNRCHPEAAVKNGKLMYVAKGPPDFTGFLVSDKGSLAVALDAKETRQDRFHFDAIRPHQATKFERYYQLGQLAFLAVRWYNGPGKFDHQDLVLPWATIRDAYHATPSGTWDLTVDTIPMTEDGWISTIPRLMSLSKVASRVAGSGGGLAPAAAALLRHVKTIGPPSSLTTGDGGASRVTRAATESVSPEPSDLPEATSPEGSPSGRRSRGSKTGTSKPRTRKSSSTSPRSG
jgi:hypothetical protein